MLSPHHYTVTPAGVLYVVCSVGVVPDLLLIVFASRIAAWFQRRSGKAISANVIRVIGSAGLLVVGFAAWTVHFHSPECVGCGGK